MAKDEKKTVTVHGVEYDLDSLTDTQKAMVNHITDLDRKISNVRFNLDQLTVGREAFVDMLAKSLTVSNAEVEDAEVAAE